MRRDASHAAPPYPPRPQPTTPCDCSASVTRVCEKPAAKKWSNVAAKIGTDKTGRARNQWGGGGQLSYRLLGSRVCLHLPVLIPVCVSVVMLVCAACPAWRGGSAILPSRWPAFLSLSSPSSPTWRGGSTILPSSWVDHLGVPAAGSVTHISPAAGYVAMRFEVWESARGGAGGPCGRVGELY